MRERGLGRGLDHLIEQNATELGFLDAYGPAPEEVLGELHDAACLVLSVLEGVRSKASYEADGVKLVREAEGSRLTWTGQHLPLVDSDLQLPGMREGVLSPARESAEVLLVDWTHEVRRCLKRVVEHHSRSA
ncbi:MAG: hypothetical protein CMA56_01315 [Euryarchaeota archaeon]|nr:hypothetical protein [Euryarchaeota archaeon]